MRRDELMNNLVFEKTKDLFTDSFVIAKETENEHRAVRQLIKTYEKQFKEFGTLYILNVESTGGRPEQYYELNEMQATFLITLLRNNKKVIDFKVRLVKEFYRMRHALMERQSTEWLQTREKGKLIRRDETDAIQLLIPYAEEQGSKNTNRFYVNYSKMVNKAVGLETGQRDTAPYKTLMLVALIEDMISHTILEEMERGVYYKEIYQICKRKVEQFTALAYLSAS